MGETVESDGHATGGRGHSFGESTDSDYVVNRHQQWEPPLSPRESEVLCHIATGLTDAQIAASLTLSTLTVSTHVKRLMRKLGVGRRSAAVATALQNKLIVPRNRPTQE